MVQYCRNYFNRSRFKTRVVRVGIIDLGGSEPIRVQSMTTADTMDTQKSVEEAIRMIDAGCEIVRLTAPSKKEAENLFHIKTALRKRGYTAPLVADIHFTPNAAELAAQYVEKVRINPGNYADKKKFEEHNYDDVSYKKELDRIEEKFTPLVKLCKERKVAMRIGTNHGSLSDRILSRYGDTPEGMVASAMEFLEICLKHDYRDIVISMKASNTVVMVQAYRLLVATMIEKGMDFPLHLGVTEAGDGEDGRIKSAVGIGALLEDGIGDTIRVSLTEAAEEEIPVARKLIEKYNPEHLKDANIPEQTESLPYSPYNYERRQTLNVVNIGSDHVPVVIGDLSKEKEIKPAHLFAFGYTYSPSIDKWNISDFAADYIYFGEHVPTFELPGSLGAIVNFKKWKSSCKQRERFYPLVDKAELNEIDAKTISFLRMNPMETSVDFLHRYPKTIVLLESPNTNKTQLFRYNRLIFAKNNIQNPIILCSSPVTEDPERFQLWSSIDVGATLIDGYGDGLFLRGEQPKQLLNSTSFGILQATRTRISKTEYISCPSCGRTLFDLQETTAKIRAKTAHLKGLKIGIMGCIVNGPGEMADADYGYVGTGPGKIHLYKEKTVVRKNVPEEIAVEALIAVIKENGDWIDPVE